jgi:3-oxoacyl-[acyl-carrier protein] reductase
MRNVIVTGGSRGLGLEVTRRLVTEGYRSVVIARSMNDELATVMKQTDQSGPGSLCFAPFDLGDTDAIPELVRNVYKEFGPIYGLVNNAALGSDGTLAVMPNSQIEKLIRLNTLSPIILTKYVVRRMMSDGGGRIVNIASITAFTGYSGLSVYAATKSSMVGFTRSLAREVGRLGITVNAVAPGFMDTVMTQGMEEEQRQKIMRRSALRRFPATEDVADAVEFLLGDRSKNITGTVLTVDAGSTA